MSVTQQQRFQLLARRFPISLAPRACQGTGNVYTMAIHSIRRFEDIMSGQSVLKWGNSLAFRIPAAIAKQMALSVGEQVEFHFDGEKLIIEKSDEVSPFSHRDLMRALKRAKRQRQEKVDFGAPRGGEIL
jgi:antitoxin component of MazEF toxin-antitoxin module